MTDGAEVRRYGVRAADLVGEREAIARVLVEGFPEFSPAAIDEKLASQYLSNPDGPADCVALEVVASGELAGMQGLLHRRFESAQGPIHGAVMADYVIRPAHRTLGPALQLLKGAISIARTRGGFLYGFPNARASVVFARAGLAPRIQLTRYAYLVRTEAVIRRRLPPAIRGLARGAAIVGNAVLAFSHLITGRFGSQGLSWSEPETFGQEFDELWSAFDRAGLVAGDRSARTLAWRFPRAASYRSALARWSGDGSLVGYVVWRAVERLVLIHDVFCLHPTRDLATVLLGFANLARRSGAEVISIEFAGPPVLVGAVRRAGFVARETSPVHLVVVDARHTPEDLVASLYLTGFDRDTG